MLPSVTTHSSLLSLSWCRSLCQKWKLFFVEPYLAISTNISCYQRRCRQQYCLPFSNTAHAWTSAWCAQHSSTAAVHNSQLHFSWAMAPTSESWTQYWLHDLGSLQQREYELEVDKIEEIKQLLIELVISSNNNIWLKRCVRVSVFCQVVQKHCLNEAEK